MSPQEREAWEREKRHPLIGALLGGLAGAGLSGGGTALLNQRIGPETGIAFGAGGLLGALLGGFDQYHANRNINEMLEQAMIEEETEKQSDIPIDIRDPEDDLGSLQFAYVADYMGAKALERAAKKMLAHGDLDKGMYNSILERLNANVLNKLAPFIQTATAKYTENEGARWFREFVPFRDIRFITDAITAMSDNQKEQDLVGERYAKKIKKYQDKVDTSAKKVERETPFHLRLQGAMADLDSDVAGHKYMRKESPWQYWLNPIDKTGPLHELLDRYIRRGAATAAYPESTLGRFAATATPFLPLLMGGEKAKQKLRYAAMLNEIYDPIAMPEKMSSYQPYTATQQLFQSPCYA